MIAIIILLAVAVVVALVVFAVSQRQNRRFICSKFISGNIIVAGKKGNGKDLLFNYVINARKSKCKSNIQYNDALCEKAGLDYLLLKDENEKQLTYNDFLQGKFKTINKKIEECKDYYISDAGVWLPSQNQSELCKQFPSLPITYALSRHLARMNIHANTQNLNRVWDKLREQADGYFIVRKTVKIACFFFTKLTYYDDYERALHNLRPFHANKLLSSKEKRALQEQYTATNGLIIDMWIVQKSKKLKYDTREFHKTIYGVPAPKKN